MADLTGMIIFVGRNRKPCNSIGSRGLDQFATMPVIQAATLLGSL